MRRVAFLSILPLTLVAISSLSQGQAVGGAASAAPVELAISGPRVIHRGDNVFFTATLTNRSSHVMAVPSKETSRAWTYVGGEWWKIADNHGRQLKFKPSAEIPFDNMVGAQTYQDGDFVLIKPGETIEYTREALGDPSDKFAFPGSGTYFVSLSWKFCAPTVKAIANGVIGYTCGVTNALSPSVKDAVLATPSYEVQSNIWKISLE